MTPLQTHSSHWLASQASFVVAAMAICVLAPSVVGCRRSGPEIGSVSGKVTLDGKPLPDAFVFFRHADGGRISEAFTDDSGKYTLNYSSDESGAMVGPNSVRISTFIEAVREDSGAIVKGTNKKELVPARYNKQTELSAEVKSGRNTINFDLKSK